MCHVDTLMGQVVYERAYYHCCHCRQGHFPTDAEFGVERRKTPAVREVVSLMGQLEPFDDVASKALPRVSGLALSSATARRITEDVGGDVAERRSRGESFGPDRVWKWNRDARGRTVGYVSLDATSVPQQGPHAEKAEGRMPWVGEVFNPQPTHERVRRRRVGDARYVAGLMSLPEIRQQLRRECRAVGLGQVDVVVALSDGGNGLGNALLETVAGLGPADIEFVLDFHHVSDHLQEFANGLFPTSQSERKKQLETWCHQLKHAAEGLAHVATGDYAGEHWLASYAVLLLT